MVQALQQELGDQLRFVYRNFPLIEIHPHALHAALAVEAADAQGKFWQMHDYLFHHQHTLTDADLAQFADLFLTGLEESRTTNAPFIQLSFSCFVSGRFPIIPETTKSTR